MTIGTHAIDETEADALVPQAADIDIEMFVSSATSDASEANDGPFKLLPCILALLWLKDAGKSVELGLEMLRGRTLVKSVSHALDGETPRERLTGIFKPAGSAGGIMDG